MSSSWFNLLTEGQSPQDHALKIKERHSLPWVTSLESLAQKSKSALSLGSGIGDVEARLALSGISVTGIELSKESVDYSRQLFHAMSLRGDFHTGDITEALPFKDNSFDLVFSCTVLQFFTEEQLRGILKEAVRVAKKEVIVLLPNALCAPYRIGKWHMQRTGRWPWGNERPFSSLRPYFPSNIAGYREFSVGTRHALDFLRMRGGSTVRRLLTRTFGLVDHPRPSPFRQGYMLIGIAQKQ